MLTSSIIAYIYVDKQHHNNLTIEIQRQYLQTICCIAQLQYIVQIVMGEITYYNSILIICLMILTCTKTQLQKLPWDAKVISAYDIRWYWLFALALCLFSYYILLYVFPECLEISVHIQCTSSLQATINLLELMFIQNFLWSHTNIKLIKLSMA